MTIARSVADVLRNHVVLEYESIDRMYLNVYVPHLQTVGSVVGYLRVHHDLRFASTSAVAPMTDAFVRNVEEFVAAEDVDLVGFQKNQRKDEVTQKRLRKFKKNEGVLYVGKAQEKARVMRTERRRCSRTGATYPWISLWRLTMKPHAESVAPHKHTVFGARPRASNSPLRRPSSAARRIAVAVHQEGSLACGCQSEAGATYWRPPHESDLTKVRVLARPAITTFDG